MGKKIRLQTLSNEAIRSSPEIQQWLLQFPPERRIAAQSMLSRLRFVSRDSYSQWLLDALSSLPQGKTCALFAVRKTEKAALELWDDEGQVIARPGISQGSEDLVYSLISNAKRSHPTRFFDHPGIEEIRKQRIKYMVLIDDSIGSGDRVSEFIGKMFANKSFLSWWSLGWVRIIVLSFSRTHESESVIRNALKGSSHPIRVHPKSTKIHFISDKVYSAAALEQRWGKDYLDLLHLCDEQTRVGKWARRGFGNVMANTLFFHSVPNNMPGIFWFSNDRWKGLFPGRVAPDWLISLLSSTPPKPEPGTLSEDIRQLLLLVKRGIRNSSSLALRLGCDHKYLLKLLDDLKRAGLVNSNHRLTRAGLNLIKRHTVSSAVYNWNRELYIPTQWRVGQPSIQQPKPDN